MIIGDFFMFKKDIPTFNNVHVCSGLVMSYNKPYYLIRWMCSGHSGHHPIDVKLDIEFIEIELILASKGFVE
jgi:hypothetical protein